MNGDLLRQLTAQQDPQTGAFTAQIDWHGSSETDCNGFATALVLRSLRRLTSAHPNLVKPLTPLTCRGLDFLERCAVPSMPGAFGFWPVDARPAWARRMPADVDDTAIFNLELALSGRRTDEELQCVVYQVLMPTLLTDPHPYSPPWFRPLVFPTWLSSPGRLGTGANPVDCCVNANVTALLRWCKLPHLPGYAEACAMITAGLEWVEQGMQTEQAVLLRLSTLTPYYPNPFEFEHALQHAVTCGVLELEPALNRLRNLLSNLHVPQSELGAICGNAYCGPYWRCTALTLVRAEIGQCNLNKNCSSIIPDSLTRARTAAGRWGTLF